LVCPGRKPFDEIKTSFASEVEALIKEGVRPTIPDNTYPEYSDLIKYVTKPLDRGQN